MKNNILFILLFLVSCTPNNKKNNKDNLPIISDIRSSVLLKNIDFTEKVDTICKGQEIQKELYTTHVIFCLNNKDNNKKVNDSIDFYLNDQFKRNIAINKYRSRFILTYSPLPYKKEGYPYVVNVYKDSIKTMKIDFFMRGISLKYSPKFHAPYVYIILKEKNIEILYFFCTSYKAE